MEIDVLEWDTDFFKKVVAKITINQNEDVDFNSLFSYCKEHDFKLNYIFVDYHNTIVINKVRQLLGSPINTKITFESETINPENFKTVSGAGISIKPVSKLLPNLKKILLKLALAAGAFSRFKVDKKLSETAFENMYCEWVGRLINDDKGIRIIIASTHMGNEDIIIGFLAYSISDTAFKIEFISVDKEWKKKGIGKALIKNIMEEAMRENIHHITVETQKENVEACNFYSSCGFKVNKLYCIYHVHL